MARESERERETETDIEREKERKEREPDERERGKEGMRRGGRRSWRCLAKTRTPH